MRQFTPRYPKAFGHQAWSLHGSVEDALIQDLFWRKTQINQNIVINIVKIIDKNAKRDNSDIFLSDNTAISLYPESCGAYTTEMKRRVDRLQGIGNDNRQPILDAEKCPASGGYYLGPLFQCKKGWLLENVCSNIFQSVDIPLTPKDRYLFNQKASHYSVLMKDKDKQNAHQAIQNSFLIDFGFKRYKVYWYSTEDGSTAFGIVYFYNESGKTTKLPISAWEPVEKFDGNVVFDLLHPNSNCPLYGLQNIADLRSRSKYVLICANEDICETIENDHAWIPKTLPVTTYSALELSDWASLGSMTPIIFPENTVDGCHEAYKLFLTLQAQGLSPIFLKRQAKKLTNQIQHIVNLAQDISPLAFPDGECSLTEFAEHCRREFGVEPPQGILPQGQPLLELPGGKSDPEPLLERLLSLGDQMTLIARRGEGKSLFALLLALSFANGHKALNGRVCPSRKYRVLLLDGEMPPNRLKKRACSITKGLGLPEDAANEIIVRSSVQEKKEIRLDTDEGWEDLLPDLEKANIIIIDSLFKFFPSCMSSEISSATALNNFYDWCRKHGKTAIVVDHQGKKGDTAFGTMGKEMTVDAVLQLKRNKDAIEATVTKNRNFESSTNCWVKYSIKNESGGMTFQPIDQAALALSAAVLPAGKDESIENSSKRASARNKPDIDQAILDYVKKHPGQSQGEVCDAIVATGICKRAAAHNHYKGLRIQSKITAPEEADTSQAAE
ncbi:MAG: AAA family ATPase [Desulfovibrio sp.]|uniref:AAA family ATPase n=1 Tax=Desulfovibrio sp. TaxID=885 RepID=UPI0039E49CC0